MHYVPGRLHLSHVEAGDAQEGQTYVCLVRNSVLNKYVQGEDQRVEPQLTPGSAYFVICTFLIQRSPFC